MLTGEGGIYFRRDKEKLVFLLYSKSEEAEQFKTNDENNYLLEE